MSYYVVVYFSAESWGAVRFQLQHCSNEMHLVTHGGFGSLGKFIFSQRHRHFIYTIIIALLINIRAQCLEARFQYAS